MFEHIFAGVLIGLACFGAAATGAVFSPGTWYERLAKPSWTPPNWAFPVVWSILYIMIGVAGWRVWATEGLGLGVALWTFQIVSNASWSPVFFGLRRMDLGMVAVSVLWASVAACVFVFAGIDRVAALLMAPYLLWVTIAAALNWSLLRLNPGERAPA